MLKAKRVSSIAGDCPVSSTADLGAFGRGLRSVVDAAATISEFHLWVTLLAFCLTNDYHYTPVHKLGRLPYAGCAANVFNFVIFRTLQKTWRQGSSCLIKSTLRLSFHQLRGCAFGLGCVHFSVIVRIS